MSDGFYSSAIKMVDQHPQLGELHYTAVVTVPLGVPRDKLDRVVIRAFRLAHNEAVNVTQEAI